MTQMEKFIIQYFNNSEYNNVALISKNNRQRKLKNWVII